VKKSIPSLDRQEFLVAVGNPKAILIFTAFLPQFLAGIGLIAARW
jgi:threonine/homoserine/homoserine lactone efflux protein